MPFIYGNKKKEDEEKNKQQAKKPIVKPGQQNQQPTTTTTPRQNTKTPYQQNVASLYKSNNSWYKGDEPTASEVWGQIYKVNRTDPLGAQKIASGFMKEQQTQGSKYYNPYSRPTNQAVSILQSYGIDTNTLTDEWYAKNQEWQKDLRYGSTSNSPLSPTKKATDAQIVAYNLYQYRHSDKDTKKAQQEVAALQQELAYKANNPGSNATDDDIINGIDWKKYPTLAAAAEGKNQGKLTEFNDAINFTEDDMRGWIWAARNGIDYDNNTYNMAMSALGEGRVWEDRPDIAAKLNWNDKSTYSPYEVGMTLDPDVGLYFGVYSFDQDTIDKLRATIDPNDETAVKNFQKAEAAWKTTQQAQAERENIYAKVDRYIDRNMSEDTIIKNIDRLLGTSEYKTLAAMDESIENGSKLVELTGAVDYNKKKLLQYIHDKINKTGEFGTASDIANGTLSPASGTEPGIKKTKDQIQKEATDIIRKQRIEQLPNAEPGAESEIEKLPLETVEKEDQREYNTALERYDKSEMRTAYDSVYGEGAYDRDIVAAESASSASQAQKDSDQYVNDTVDSFGDSFTARESARLEGYSGASDQAQAIIKEKKNSYLSGAESPEALINRNGEGVRKNYIESGLDVYQRCLDYENKLTDLEYMRSQLKTIEDQLGDKIYADKVQDNSFTTTINGDLYRVTMSPDLSEIEAIDNVNKSDVPVPIYASYGLYDTPEEYDDETKIWYAIENSSEVDAFRQKYAEEAGKIQAAKGMELTEEDQNLMKQMRQIQIQIEDDEQYIRDYKNQYKADTDAFHKIAERRDVYIQNLMDMGADTSEIETDDAVFDILTTFTKYEATKWDQYNPSYAYATKIADGEKKEKVLADAETEHNEMLEQAKDIEWIRNYCQKHNINIPDNVKQNMDRRLAKIKRDTEDYEYFKLQFSDEFDKIAAEQKAKDDEASALYLASHRLNNESMVPGSIYASFGGLDYYLSDDERNTWYYLKAQDEKNGTHKADDYAKFMTDDTYGVLPTRATIGAEEGAKELTGAAGTAGLGFLLGNTVAVLLSPYNAVASGVYAAKNILTGKELNPNSHYLQAMNVRSATREQSAQEIKETFGKPIVDEKTGKVTGYEDTILSKLAQGGYEILTNRLDSAINAASFGWMFGGIGGEVLREFLSAAPMGVSAGMEAAARAKEKGATDAQAYLIGSITFFAETATEAISLENMSAAFNTGAGAKTIKQFLKNWLTKAGINEMAGETINDVIEYVADSVIMKDMSERSDIIYSYRVQGYSKEEAEALANKDMVSGFLRTALISYLSPGLDIVSYGAGRIKHYDEKTQKYNKENPDNKKTIRQIRKEVLTEQKAELAKQREQAQKELEEKKKLEAENPNRELKPIDYDALEERYGQGESWKAQQEARNLEQEEQRKKKAASNIIDFEVLESAKTYDKAGKNSAVAAVLDEGSTQEETDRANAAATNLQNVFGQETEVAGEVQDLLIGAQVANVDPSSVKKGLQYAALGGEQSACRQVIQSEAYQNATPDAKAQMLAIAAAKDSQNQTVNDNVAKAVHEDRVAKKMGELIANGEADDIKRAEVDVELAEVETHDAEKDLKTQQDIEQSARTEMERSSAEAVNNPKDDGLGKVADMALDKLLHMAEVTRQYKQHLEKARQKEAAARQKAEDIRQKTLTKLRQNAEAMVAQEDQARAQQAEQARVEAEQQAAEQAKQKQAQNEEEAAVENEIKTNREQYIRQRLQESGYTGEALEKQVRRVMGYADQKSRGEENTSAKLFEKDGDKFLRKISRMTGITYEMQDLGNPLTNRGKIIDRNHMILNSNLTRGQALVEAALHEVTHGLENTKAYNNYASFVLNAMYGGENTEAYNEAIKQKLAEYAKEFNNLSPEEAQKMARYELVAEYARLNLGKKEFLRGITSTGLAGKFRDVLSNAIAMLKGYTLDAEGKAKYQELRKAMKLLNECIKERTEHIKESNNGHTGLVQASITGWTDATGLTLEVTDDDSHVYRLFNNGQEIKPGEYKAEMVKGTPVGNLIDMAGKSRIETLTNRLERGKISEKEYNKQLNEIAKTAKQQREYVAQIINMIGQYQDAAMVWELAGSLAFSSLKTNGDPQYSDSYDFGTICTKTQAILNAISQTQIDLGRALTKEEIDGIVYEEVGKGVQDKNGKWIHGATPCPPCYVYATWVNKPARLEKVRLYQQECANWTNEQINEFMNRPAPEGRTKSETNELKTEQNSQKLWISLCLADEVTDSETGKKTWVRKENPDICPNEILLDLRRSGDMAVQHPGTWTFMQKGGNAQGKAIAPYSDARLGESIVAKAIGASKANEQLLEDERNAGNSEYIPQFLNPFLSADPNDQKQAEAYFKKAIQKIKAQNLKGGQRWQSWSDFRAEWGSDYLMEMITMQALGSQVQTYTKVVEAIDLLASAGFEVNMSLMPHGDGFWHNEDGSIKIDEDGNMMLRFSNVTGINPEAAEAFARKYGEKGNVQPMVVGISDEHIKAALAGNYITFVIPFHGSGGSVQRLQHLMSLLHEQMESGNDYTKAQSDDFENYITVGEGKTKKKVNTNPNWTIREMILTGEYEHATDEEIDALDNLPLLKKLYEDRYLNEDSDAFGVFFSKGEAQQIYPYEYWDTNTTLATADENSKLFIDYCKMLGVIPRFSGLTKTVGKGKNAHEVEYANFSGRKVVNGESTYEPVKGYWKLLIDRPMYNRVYDENGKIIPEKCTYHKPQAVSTADINIGAMPMAANNTVGHSDDDTRAISERIIQRIEMTSGQNEAAGSAVDLEQNAEAINKAINEESGVQKSDISEQKSQLGDLSKDEMDKLLIDAGIITEKELKRLNRTDRGEGERQFNTVTGPKSDVFDERAMQYIQNHNRYIQDTNSAELSRAIKWVTDKATEEDPDGYQHALTTVTDSSFNYHSKDGQARMIVMMGMAAAKGDVHAQVELLRDYGRQGTTLAQALQARKLFTLMTPQGRMLAMERMLNNTQNEINKKGTNIKLAFADWVYQAAANAESEEDFDRVRQMAINELAQQIPANWKDRIRSLRMLSMLANPRTHIRNIIGNMMFMPAVSMKNKIGALMELGKPQGERTKTLSIRLSDSIRQFTRQDADNIKGILTGEAKFNEATKIRKAQTKLGTALDWISDLNSKALEKEDWWFLKPHYARALGGWMQANGYTVEQMQSNPELLEKGRAYAVEEAQKATYRDFNKVSKILNDVSRQGGIAGFAVDAILPFKKTPANILRRGIEYSPAGIVKSLTADMYHMKQYQDYQNGKLNELPEKAISPNQFIDHLCAGLSGTAIMTLGFLLAGTGAVSAGLGDDDDEFEKAKGAQKYAINPGKAMNNLFHTKLFGEDVTYTMDWAAPMSMPFFVGAAIRDQMENGGDLDIDGIINAFGNITEPVTNLTMLDGVNTLFKTSQYDDTNTLTQIGAKTLTNYVTSYVPSALGAIARTFFDDKTRKAYVESGKGTGIMGTLRYAIEQTQNKIPILNRQNIAARDIWGNEKTSSFIERLFENFISPGYIEHYEEDPIINEMSRLYDKTGSKDMLLKPDPAKSFSFTVGGEKHEYKLTDKQWDQYKASRNNTAYLLLSELLNSSDYQNANDNIKVQMIDNVWDYADKIGKKAVASEYELKDYGENAIGEISRESRITGYKNEIIKALNAGDYDAYDTMLEAIREEYDEEKDADSVVKTKIGDTYREKWKKAYRDNDYVTMNEIEDILDNTGFTFNIYGKDGWMEKEDEKMGN